ncbi:ParE family toxin-like protein [Adhaeretor mobilis]|uniref:ParE-like toxin domain-containing protein n=1 Tax=Adhaeretor mobilis TaxID=1930276 RepID=A0A517N240_9BACT|nr:hypothetical protein [Adhaeretor mobilis]QDT01193.1 hypothetical protein HG15A2_45350 [Adhaeretor mobilis]
MKSSTTQRFRERLAALPERIQREARESYRLFLTAPHSSSLRFKRVNRKRPYYSARVGRNYRVLGMLEDVTINWFWIGPHDEYDRLVAALN